MAVGVVAQAEDLGVLFIRIRWIEKPVAGAELQFSRDINHEINLFQIFSLIVRAVEPRSVKM